MKDDMSGSWRITGGTIIVGLVMAVFPPSGRTADEPQQRERQQERKLVEDVYKARENYEARLERLHAFYVHTNNDEGRRWVEKELTDYRLLVKNPYLLDMDLPDPGLTPDTSIPQANRIFRDALDWLNRRSLTEREENYKRAELLFRRLLRDYPRSDKLDETCYYLGEIYSSKYFQQYRRAAAFYERVIHYQPNTNLDARLRAAHLYEHYIEDRQRAISLYQEVLRREVDPTQTREAKRRLDILLGARASTRQ
jgi:TolA-binding protein